MVFYFTATGNSLYVAKQLEYEFYSIPQVLKQEDLFFESDRIGIVCPIYGHEMPKMVKEFIKKANFKTEYFYIVLTYGALHGGAAELAEKYLKSVNKSADYITSIIMVDNFLPNFDMTMQCSMDKNIFENVTKIKADIENRVKKVEKAKFKDKMIHKGYLFMVKNQNESIWAKFKVEDGCNGCGICVKVCPANAIVIDGKKALHTNVNCQSCYACVHACPQKAIGFTIGEKNPNARYRNENIHLEEIIEANNQR